jgi:thiamine-phosphate pyrophosphorylase
MKLPRLYAITDENVISNNRLIEGVETVLRAGVRLLQVRFKKTPYDEQVELGRKLRELTRKYDTIFIVNDSPELAAELDADGVHLGADDPSLSHARKLLGPDAIIGVSCYGCYGDAERVASYSPDTIAYIGLSSPYVSATKQKDVVSLSNFKALVGAARVPVYAIGGITVDKISEVLSSESYGYYGGCYGCYGVAVISAIFGADNPGQSVKDFLDKLKHSSE